MIPPCPPRLCGESSAHDLGPRACAGNRSARACIIFLLGVLLLVPSAAEAQGSTYINPPTLVKPTGYTHVVLAPDGRTAYIAGQVALDSTGQLVGANNFEAQARRVFENLRRALASVDGSLADVVKTTTYITDSKYVPALRELRARYLGAEHPPANTLVIVSALARPELLIEIEAIAVVPRVVRHTD